MILIDRDRLNGETPTLSLSKGFLLFARHVAELMVLKERPVAQAMGRQAVGKGVFGDEGV